MTRPEQPAKPSAASNDATNVRYPIPPLPDGSGRLETAATAVVFVVLVTLVGVVFAKAIPGFGWSATEQERTAVAGPAQTQISSSTAFESTTRT